MRRTRILFVQILSVLQLGVICSATDTKQQSKYVPLAQQEYREREEAGFGQGIKTWNFDPKTGLAGSYFANGPQLTVQQEKFCQGKEDRAKGSNLEIFVPKQEVRWSGQNFVQWATILTFAPKKKDHLKHKRVEALNVICNGNSNLM